jgi:flagellar biosynthesis anti-sigma factor FlgM
MKIENNHLNPVPPQSRPEGLQPGGKSTHISSASAKDRAEFSDQARLLAKARSVAQNVPEVREERVQEIKQRVTDGNYAIPVSQLARLLLPTVSGPKE